MKANYNHLFKDFFDSEKVAGLLLVFCAIISLGVANSAFDEGYVHFMHTYLNLSFSSVSLNFFFV